MRKLILLAATLVALPTLAPAPAAAQIEARQSIEQRQKDLVSLASHLGALHRLQQVCGGGYDQNLYRQRMMEVVNAEVPMGATRLDMIAAFNSSFRDMSRLYIACGEDAKAAREEEARQALAIVDRLYAPFR